MNFIKRLYRRAYAWVFPPPEPAAWPSQHADHLTISYAPNVSASMRAVAQAAHGPHEEKIAEPPPEPTITLTAQEAYIARAACETEIAECRRQLVWWGDKAEYTTSTIINGVQDTLRRMDLTNELYWKLRSI